MTAPTIEELPVRVPGRALPPRLIHVNCAVCNPDRTFCGIDFAALQQVSLSNTPTCVVCVELENAHDWAAHFWGQS